LKAVVTVKVQLATLAPAGASLTQSTYTESTSQVARISLYKPILAEFQTEIVFQAAVLAGKTI
jgi:hypothetical protein